MMIPLLMRQTIKAYIRSKHVNSYSKYNFTSGSFNNYMVENLYKISISEGFLHSRKGVHFVPMYHRRICNSPILMKRLIPLIINE